MHDFTDKLYLIKGAEGRRRQVLLHQEDILRILAQYHDDAGHCGQHTTEENIASYYYWPRMRDYVKDYVSD